MDIDVKLSRLVLKAPALIYAKRVSTNTTEELLLRLANQKDPYIESFASREECDQVWREFTRIMMHHCAPPCIGGKKVLFQPAYLLKIVCYSDLRAHFGHKVQKRGPVLEIIHCY